MACRSQTSSSLLIQRGPVKRGAIEVKREETDDKLYVSVDPVGDFWTASEKDD